MKTAAEKAGLRLMAKEAARQRAAFPDQPFTTVFQSPPQRATRHGQREIVAATLAAGLITSDHTRTATVENAVALMREVLFEMEKQD